MTRISRISHNRRVGSAHHVGQSPTYILPQPVRHGLGALWALALLCAAPFTALAQALPDPTKPPAEISAPVSEVATPKDSGLQSIIISPARRAAIINGETVELGAKLGDATLIEISEGHVVLESAQGRQVLTLFPGVDIKKKELLPPKESGMQSTAKSKKTVKGKRPARKPAHRVGQGEGK